LELKFVKELLEDLLLLLPAKLKLGFVGLCRGLGLQELFVELLEVGGELFGGEFVFGFELSEGVFVGFCELLDFGVVGVFL
jgi:hypothetical protein